MEQLSKIQTPEADGWEQALTTVEGTVDFLSQIPVLNARQPHHSEIKQHVFPLGAVESSHLIIATLHGGFVVEFQEDLESYTIHGVINLVPSELVRPIRLFGKRMPAPAFDLYERGYRQARIIGDLVTPSEMWGNPNAKRIDHKDHYKPYSLTKSAPVPIPHLNDYFNDWDREHYELAQTVPSGRVHITSDGVCGYSNLGIFEYQSELFCIVARSGDLGYSVARYLFGRESESYFIKMSHGADSA